MNEFTQISGKTAVYGIIGQPVSHSLSPLLHNAYLRGSDINAVYVAFPADFDTPDRLGEAMLRLGIQGLSVTIPYKELAFKCTDQRDKASQLCGASNTLINRAGQISAVNTDGSGALAAISEQNAFFDKKDVIIFGNGGTAAGITGALLNTSIQSLLIVGRNRQRLSSFCRMVSAHSPSFSVDFLTFDELNNGTKIMKATAPGLTGSRVIFQTTSIGMNRPATEEPFPLPAGFFRPGDTAFDAVYTPAMTSFLQQARSADARIVFGYDMLWQQALGQMRLFYGAEFESPAGKKTARRLREILLDRLGIHEDE